MKKTICFLLSVCLCLSMIIVCPEQANALESGALQLVYGADGTGNLASGQSERVYLENTNDLAIAGVTYSVDNEKVEVDQFGNLTVKEGALIGKGETVTVTATVSYYDEADVIFADGFEGEKKFTDTPENSKVAGQDGYTHSNQQSLYGRYSAAPAKVTGDPTKNFDAVTDVTVTAWFYDSNVRKLNQKIGFGIAPDNYLGIYYGSKESGYVSGKLATNYATKIPGISYQSYARGAVDVERSAGWHQFQWIFDQEKGLTVKIDGEPITTNASVTTTAANNTKTVKIEDFAVSNATVSSVMIWNENGDSSYTWPTINNNFFIDGVMVVKNDADVQTVAVASTAIPLKSNIKQQPTLVYGADPAVGLKKGESERLYLENIDDLAIAGVTYSTNNEKVAVDEFGNLSIKPGTTIEAGETVAVTANISYYDEADVVFADSFEGEKRFTTDTDGYTHSTQQALYGRYSAAPAEKTCFPTKNFDAVTDVTLTAWFYDSNVRELNQKIGVGVSKTNYLGLFYGSKETGYVGGKLSTNYATKIPGISYEGYATGAVDVERSAGWHCFQWIFDQEKGLTVKIDGKAITTNASVTTTAADNTETVKIENFAVADPTISSVMIWNGNGSSGYTWPTIQDNFFIDGIMVVKNDAETLSTSVTSEEILLDDSLKLAVVEGGSGSGGYEVGETVTVCPDLPEEGKAFVKWEVEGIELADPTQYKVKFEMPANDVFFTAVFEDATEAPLYPITVINGSGSGSFEADSMASIEADAAPEGKVFYKWESEEMEIEAEYSPKIKVCVPVYGAEIKAIYTEARESRDFYLDAEGGSDEADGKTPETAWKSLSMVNQIVLQPGDRVLLKAGSVFEEMLTLVGNGSEEAPVIVDMYNGSVIGIEAGELPHIKADGRFEVDGYFYSLRAENISHLEIKNLEVSNLAAERKSSIGVLIRASTGHAVKDIHLDNLYVHDVNGDLEDRRCGGIIFWADYSESRFDNVLVENCTVKNVSRSGIRVAHSADATKWDGYGGYYPADFIERYANTNVVVRNNYVEEVGGDSIVVSFCDRAVVEYNISNGASLNTKDNPSLQYNAAIWPWRCQNTVFQFNEAYNTYLSGDGQAYDCDYSENTVFQYNYSHDNEGGFMLVCKTESIGSIIRYNISQNDLRSLVSLDWCPGAEFYNNTFYIGEGLNTDIIRHNGTSVFTNNIFYNLGTKTSPNWGEEDSRWGKASYDNNLYYGYDTTPADANKIVADPLFVAPGTGGTGVCGDSAVDTLAGYALRAGSPAIDAGKLIENNGGRDYAGNPLGATAVDIGAMEFMVSYDELQTVYDDAKSLDMDQYTTESQNALLAVINRAEDMLDAKNATQNEVDALCVELEDAMDKLVLLGDTNRNGALDTADLVMLLQHLNGDSDELQTEVGDINRDGILSLSDALRLLRTISA